MTLKLTFDVFSGRPNPTVILNAQESAALLAQIGPIPSAPATSSLATADTARLGYRGLIIEQPAPVSSSVPASFRLAGNRVIGFSGTLKTVDPAIEQALLTNTALLA